MKKQSLLAILLAAFSGMLHAQSPASKWRFGLEIGANSLSLAGEGGGFRILSSKHVKNQQHWGFQGGLRSGYQLAQNWRLTGGLDLVQAQGNAFLNKEVITDLGFTRITNNDTVNQKYLLLDVPIFIRWHQTKKEKETTEGSLEFLGSNTTFALFFDIGFTLHIPLKNSSSYSRAVDYDQLINSHTDYSSGTLKSVPISAYTAFGFEIGKHSSLALAWSYLTSKATSSNARYFSSLWSLRLGYRL